MTIRKCEESCNNITHNVAKLLNLGKHEFHAILLNLHINHENAFEYKRDFRQDASRGG